MEKFLCIADELKFWERDHPRPQSVAPQIPQGQQLGTIDKLAQAVIPKIVDKLNESKWEIERLRAVCDWQQQLIGDLYNVVNGTLLPWMHEADDRLKALEAAPKKKAAPRKKKAPAEPVVDISEIADYDPDTDSYGPITIDGHKITGALIDVVTHLGPGAPGMYSEELIQFINQLEEPVKKAIAERFPN